MPGKARRELEKTFEVPVESGDAFAQGQCLGFSFPAAQFAGDAFQEVEIAVPENLGGFAERGGDAWKAV